MARRAERPARVVGAAAYRPAMSAAAGYGLAQLAGQGIQGTFDELGTPLRETTFVVVDLETTG